MDKQRLSDVYYFYYSYSLLTDGLINNNNNNNDNNYNNNNNNNGSNNNNSRLSKRLERLQRNGGVTFVGSRVGQEHIKWTHKR